jgi:hypothetical protein
MEVLVDAEGGPSLKKSFILFDDTSSIASSTNISSSNSLFDEVDADKTVGTNVILSDVSDEANKPEAIKIEDIPSPKWNKNATTVSFMDVVSVVTQQSTVSTCSSPTTTIDKHQQ